MLRSRQSQIFTQNFEQRLVRRERNLGRLAIEPKLNVGLLFVIPSF